MSLSKKLSKHEIESLYSAANSAIWRSHTIAAWLSKLKTREEDYVATLVTNGVPIFADRWISLLQPKGIELRVSGVFCHGHPQVTFNSPKLRVELADLLVVHQHTTGKRRSARAMLIQAKMSERTTLSLPKNDPQLELFSSWPPFEFVSGGLAPGKRDIRERGKGSRYALIRNRPSYPPDIPWADLCPWGTCSANQILSAERSLAKLLGDMLLGKEGRTFQLGSPKDDWSRTIQELLRITGKRTFKRTNINQGHTPRLVEQESITSGMMLQSSSQSFSLSKSGNSKPSISEQYFGDVPFLTESGDGQEIVNERRDELLEGGISTLIIETKDSES